MNHRPLSPHLQVYRPQLTSVLSIMHRITGVLLCKGIGFIIIALGIVAYDGVDLLTFLQSTPYLTIIKIAIWLMVWSAIYHWLNGLRHLLWDVGFFLELKSVYLTGWTVLFSSFLLTALLYWRWIR